MEPVSTFFARLTGITFLYAAAAIGGLMYAVVGSTVTLVWAPSGIALAALLVYGYRLSFGVALGAFLANAWTGIPLPTATVIAIGNTLEALVGAYLLVRLASFRNTLDRRRDVFALIVLAAVFSTMLSAFVGVAALALGDIISFGEYPSVWLKWWLGDMMGVLLVAPVLLVLKSYPHFNLPPSKAVEALGLFATLGFVSYKIFNSPELAVEGYYLASLAIFPFIIWGALRFNQWGSILVTLLVSIIAIWGTTKGTGPFIVDDPVNSLIRWSVFVIIMAVTGLILAASVTEQKRSQTDLDYLLENLENRVRERTMQVEKVNYDLSQEIEERRKLEAQLILVSEEYQQTIGQELHDGLGQHLTGISMLSATLQQHLYERAQPEASLAQHIVELINQASVMMRSISRGLYPTALKRHGLPAALKELVNHSNFLQEIECKFSSDPGMKIHDPLISINLYRIAQEALNNAIKHSKAKHIQIDLIHMDGKYQLSVSDNGIGFDGEHILKSQGIGMHSMRFRANLLGGRFSIEKNPMNGTTIKVLFQNLGEQNNAKE